MHKTFRPYEPDQLLLMPPSWADWLPEQHLARFVSDLLTLRLSAGHAGSQRPGGPQYGYGTVAAGGQAIGRFSRLRRLGPAGGRSRTRLSRVLPC
jgi:hypothetical protein